MKNYILVTGATGNIGGKVCAHLLTKGFNIVYTSRSKKNIEFLEQDFSKIANKSKFIGIVVDLSNKMSIQRFLQNIKKYKIVAFISNASEDNVKSIVNLSDMSLSRTMMINFEAPVMIIKALIKKWIDKRIEGKIIHISSLCASHADVNSSAYSSSKAALEAFIRCVAIEYGEIGVVANTIRLSAVSGDLIRKNQKSRIIHYYEKIKNMNHYDLKIIPSNKLLKISEVTNMVEILINKNTCLNGQSINIDMGLSSKYPMYK